VRAYKRVRGESLVVAIEPEPSNAWHLAINLNINKCKNVKVIKAACSDKDGYDFLHLHGFTGHSIILHSKKKILVRTIRLDTLTSALKQLSDISKYNTLIIKINAEGAELNILRGAVKTLKCCYAVIVATHHYPNQDSDVGMFLRKFGFTTKIICIRDNRLVLGVKSYAKS
jgi:FkbM family methyltransferase